MSDITNDYYKNPDHASPVEESIDLGLQHVLAMFLRNITPALIIGAAAGINLLSAFNWNRRNMLILVALSLSVGLSLQLVAINAATSYIPNALRYLPETIRTLMEAGLLPAAFHAVILKIALSVYIDFE